MRRISVIVAGVVALAVGGAPVSAQGLLDLFMSPAQEARIGAEQHPKILAEFGGAYDDHGLAAYVDSIGQFLALTSEAPDTRYTFTVLNSGVVNAFALPGGYVYVTRGLLALADNEAELAGVIAHEIGHVAARHGADRMSKGVLANLGLAVLGAVTDSSAVAEVAQVGALAVIQSYSREDEFEADMLGVRYLSRAGFDPDAMSSFLARLSAHGELEAAIHGRPADQGFDFLATHPRTADRTARAIAAANLTAVVDPIVARDIYFGKIDGMLFGDDPAQGMIRGQRFLHPELGFAFEVPRGFILLNGQESVLARGPEGAAIRFDGAPRQRRVSMVSFLRDQWAPEARLSRLEAIRVNGMEAATAATQAEGQGGAVDVRLLAIAFDSRTIYRFLFITPPRLTGQLNEAFRRTAFSFRPLSRNEAAQIRPRRLVIHRVGAGETARALAARQPFAEFGLDRFLVLNGLDPGQPLDPGAVVKLVVE
ncbi:MAG: M48 family metalloprotease [Alphaproteobacteria bacterium]|nr:M48 family metalloprotease [Alphaproteobacteria bacterium]MDP6517201.1 M48 family metalloprotease [Alphaproteobacteria bacterium]